MCLYSVCVVVCLCVCCSIAIACVHAWMYAAQDDLEGLFDSVPSVFPFLSACCVCVSACPSLRPSSFLPFPNSSPPSPPFVITISLVAACVDNLRRQPTSEETNQQTGGSCTGLCELTLVGSVLFWFGLLSVCCCFPSLSSSLVSLQSAQLSRRLARRSSRSEGIASSPTAPGATQRRRTTPRHVPGLSDICAAPFTRHVGPWSLTWFVLFCVFSSLFSFLFSVCVCACVCACVRACVCLAQLAARRALLPPVNLCRWILFGFVLFGLVWFRTMRL